MKIGEIFAYNIGDRLQLIRREEDYYIAYVEEKMSFYQLDELPFQILKHTVDKNIDSLAKTIARDLSLTHKDANKVILFYQKELSNIDLLDENR